ncbi:MAG: leucyl aminopeptidase [bacterium]
MVQVRVAAAKPKVPAFVVGVDSARKAPGLKALGITDAAVASLLANKDIAFPFKTVRSLQVGDKWLVLVGVGDRKKLTQEKIGTAANLGARAAAGLGCKEAATTLVLDTWGNAAAAQAVTHGAVIGGLDFDQYKTKKEDKDPSGEPAAKPNGKLDVLHVVAPAGAAGAAVKRSIARAAIVADAVNDSRLISNTPANICTPAWLASQAKSRGAEHGFAVSVKGRDQLRKEGYGALCGVAQGSVNEEQLITMDYHPKGAKKTIAVVGKGVCFDSGGISIKPGEKMWEMKYDKVGACNTIALMAALKSLGVKHRVIGVVPAVENLPSGTAQRPGDIVTAKDGTTIEVLNTDAEGRLILADALAHARTFKPDLMIDMATLTGACEVAVGTTYVAVLSNDDALARRLVGDAAAAGDKAWHLPQGEEFDEANKGTYADLQNISTTTRAGVCVGAAFIKHFAKDSKWAHLDIASKAWTGGVDYFAKGPTAAGLRIVLQRLLEE